MGKFWNVPVLLLRYSLGIYECTVKVNVSSDHVWIFPLTIGFQKQLAHIPIKWNSKYDYSEMGDY